MKPSGAAQIIRPPICPDQTPTANYELFETITLSKERRS